MAKDEGGDEEREAEQRRAEHEAKRADELVAIIGPAVFLNVVSGAMLWTARQVRIAQTHISLCL